MKDCRQVLGLQWGDSIAITSGGGASTTTTTTLQTGRGFICGVHILMDFPTLLAAAGSQINIIVNGVVIIENVDASLFGNEFNGAEPMFVPFLTPGGIEMEVRFNNISGAPQTATVIPKYSQDPNILVKYQRNPENIHNCEQVLGLRLQSARIAIGATSTADAQVVLDTGRGFVTGFTVFNTLTVLTDASLFVINRSSINGNTILENVNGIQIAPQYNNTLPYYQAQTPGGVTVDINATNGSAVAASIIFATYWTQDKRQELNY